MVSTSIARLDFLERVCKIQHIFLLFAAVFFEPSQEHRVGSGMLQVQAMVGCESLGPQFRCGFFIGAPRISEDKFLRTKFSMFSCFRNGVRQSFFESLRGPLSAKSV